MLPGGRLTTFSGSFIVDDFARFLKILALIGSVATLVLSAEFLADPSRRIFEYSILVLLSTLGMMVLISAADLIMLYLGLELMSLALYVIAAIDHDNLRSTEAALKCGEGGTFVKRVIGLPTKKVLRGSTIGLHAGADGTLPTAGPLPPPGAVTTPRAGTTTRACSASPAGTGPWSSRVWPRATEHTQCSPRESMTGHQRCTCRLRTRSPRRSSA